MAAKKKAAQSTGALVVNFNKRTDKKHVVRFDTTDPDAAVTSVYVTNAAMEELGDPKALTLTIEAA